MENKLNELKADHLQQIKKAQTLQELDDIFLKLFGKNGQITLVPKDFPSLPKEELKTIAPLFNQVKNNLEQAIKEQRSAVREKSYQKLNEEALDIQPVALQQRSGFIHPVIKIENEIIELFEKLGFFRFEAPQIDSDQYNFELLNIPAGHPARDLWDTLYIDSQKYGINPGQLLLRTHTSNAQVRVMEKVKPPFRAMIIDRCFRYENIDPRHEHTLEQFEVVLVEKGLSMANLQYLSEYFLKNIFGQDIKVRMRPKYYPFVEPGVGVDGECIFCYGKGCKICGEGWLELAGAGMIHPKVLKNGGINPQEFSGIAWGFGPERMAMLKYGLADIRIFNSGNLTELEKIK
ncbi:MAG: phenylalanine--tRNA ligase subunit alpha [Patescibacteria group bacterium]|nr:phenylalanine--tRNA ligase subunit alpha [Patescibacteria group bacterium]